MYITPVDTQSTPYSFKSFVNKHRTGLPDVEEGDNF